MKLAEIKQKIKKQTLNDFLAFRAIYDHELITAIDNDDIKEIENIINKKYQYEKENDFYIDTSINLQEVKSIYKVFANEINNK